MGKAHVGTKKFLDAFTENDNPWDRWSPPVFDDDGFLAYQRSLGVKPQKYSREIVFQHAGPHNARQLRRRMDRAGGRKALSVGSPLHLLPGQTRTIDTLRDLVDTGVAAKHPVYLQLDIFDPHQPFSIPAGFEERERELRRAITLPRSYEAVRARDFRRGDDEAEILDVYRKYWGIYDPQDVAGLSRRVCPADGARRPRHRHGAR